MIKIYPSILAADPLNLGRDVERILNAGADGLHVDIMDAHFVPNLSFSPAVVRAIRDRFPEAYQDVHLMMERPERYVAAFAEAGADAVTIHAEIGGDVRAVLQDIRARGLIAGISVKPATPAERVLDLLPLCGCVLVMTVEPGFGGQRFKREMLPKIRLLRENGYKGQIIVDGGVNAETAALCLAAGADTLVMGTALLRSEHPADLMAHCRALEGRP